VKQRQQQKEEMQKNSGVRGRSSGQGLPGLCETWMSNTSPQGWVHGGSRQALTTASAGMITASFSGFAGWDILHVRQGKK
jgi:hypothetical protein